MPGTNRRLAVDKIMVHGLRALERAGFEVLEGEVVTERTRAIKGPDEILAMRCAHHACESAIAEMEAFTRSENVPKGGVRGRHLGRTAQGQHPARRRMDRDAASGLGPAHQPVVPGMRAADRAEQRDRRLRHRPDRRLWHLHRHLAHLVGGRRTAHERDDFGHEPWAGPHPRPSGAAEARGDDPRADLRRPPAGGPVLEAEIQLQDARRGPVRRMALCALPRRLGGRRLRGGAGTRHGAVHRGAGLARGRQISRSSWKTRC
jgi:hypothetical protein